VLRASKELNYFGRDNNRENNNTIQGGAPSFVMRHAAKSGRAFFV
jgi:hypothetical protein